MYRLTSWPIHGWIGAVRLRLAAGGAGGCVAQEWRKRDKGQSTEQAAQAGVKAGEDAYGPLDKEGAGTCARQSHPGADK